MKAKLYWIYEYHEEEYRDSYYGTYTVRNSLGYVKCSKLELKLLIRKLNKKANPEFGDGYWYEECEETSINKILEKEGIGKCKVKE